MCICGLEFIWALADVFLKSQMLSTRSCPNVNEPAVQYHGEASKYNISIPNKYMLRVSKSIFSLEMCYFKIVFNCHLT